MEEKKEKKSKKWIIILILIVLILSILIFLGSMFVPTIISLLKNKSGNTINENITDSEYDGFITIEYGKRVTIMGKGKDMYDGLMYINGYDEDIYAEYKENETDNTLIEALESILRMVIENNKLSNNTGVLFVDVEYVRKNRQGYLDVISKALNDNGLTNVEIVSYKYDDLTDQAKDYLKLQSGCYSKVQYASLIAKNSTLKFEDLLNKSNSELKTTYKKYVSSGSTVKENTTTNNTTTTKPSSKCNNGYVYVKEEKKCFNSHKTKAIIKNSCGSNQVSDANSCYDIVSNDKCDSGDDRYIMKSGKCVDNYSISERSWKCPKGYANIWGNYGGQTFNGDCYHYQSPNY